jgi:hypothetical protein
MTYSCGIFEDLDGDIRSANPRYGDKSNIHLRVNGDDGADRDDLHEAQMRKYRHVIQKTDVKPHHRVLEIGSGAFPSFYYRDGGHLNPTYSPTYDDRLGFLRNPSRTNPRLSR